MLNFIWNPAAGKGKAVRCRGEAEKILSEAGAEYQFWPTKDKADAARIARELYEKGERDIIAAGGDGTIHDVLNGLPSTEGVRFGVLPCGSGNDFCAGVGIPKDVKGATELLLKGQAKPTDYMVCSGIRSLNVLGTGIDVDILKYAYSCRILKGSLAYFVSLLRALLHFKFYGFEAEYAGEKGHHNALVVCVCNARYIGGGIPICPGAVCDDGKLELVLVENVTSKLQIPPALIRLMKGGILDLKFTKHVYTDSVKVKLDRPGTVQIDGELYEDLPFDVSIVRGGIEVYRP